MKKKRFLAIFFIAFLYGSIQAADTKINSFYDVRSYGAKGDGIHIDSEEINKAITAASANGGGTVYVPAGNYLCGTIRLKSFINLTLETGATLIALTENAELYYDQPEKSVNDSYQDFGHSYFHNSLIVGDSLQDISITGSGRIWGKGLLRESSKQDKRANKAISLFNCRNVIIRDISILHGGWFGILATGVDNFTIDNIKIDTNRDGIDIDCCKNVRISNSFINSPYDDGVCLKSSYALGYARVTENVTITNCQVSGYDEGTLLDGSYQRTKNYRHGFRPVGRIKLGTESNGGFKNICISNCVFDYCRGLAIESVDGAVIEDISISNITMRDVVNDPIFIDLGNRMRGPKGVAVGKIRRIKISNLIAYNVSSFYACTLMGLEGNEVEDIELTNIRIHYKGSGNKELADSELPPNGGMYPEPGMLGPSPAYGMYVRDAKNIQLKDIHFEYLEKELRPAFYFERVDGLRMLNIDAQQEKEDDAIRLKEISNFTLDISRYLDPQKVTKTNSMQIKRIQDFQ